MALPISSLKESYDEHIGQYRQLCDVVKERLEQVLRSDKLKVHTVRHRTKTFESFYNKVRSKGYAKPLEQCQDLAGCRVICLFQDQVPLALDIIRKSFHIVSETKKQPGLDQFAYRAHHIIVRMPKGTVSAQLQTLACEIQVRTILQDAWAEIEHYVNYKHIGIDEAMKRKVNALAALLEIAEDEFYLIHRNFQELKDGKSITQKEQLSPILLYHYAKTTFPWAWEHHACFENLDNLDEYAILVEQFAKKKATSIQTIHEAYERHHRAIDQDEAFHIKEINNNPKQWPVLYQRVHESGHFYSPLLMLKMLAGKM